MLAPVPIRATSLVMVASCTVSEESVRLPCRMVYAFQSFGFTGASPLLAT